LVHRNCRNKEKVGRGEDEDRVKFVTAKTIAADAVGEEGLQAGADPSVAKWGHWPQLKFLNSYSFYLYLIEIYSDFANLYKECPQSLDLPPLPNYSVSATGFRSVKMSSSSGCRKKLQVAEVFVARCHPAKYA
jgi:hypothetical protein